MAMRLGLYTDTFLPLLGGAEMVLHRLASEMKNRGHSVCVIAPRVSGADEPTLPYHVVRYRKPFSKRFGVKLILPRLLRMHRREPFDLLHCHAAYPQAYVAAEFSRRTGVPYVVRPHGSDVVPGRHVRRDPTLEPRLREGLMNAAAVIAQGDSLKQVIVDLSVVPSERIVVIHNGVNLDDFVQSELFDHPRPYILGLGNLIKRKGFDLLLRAFAKINSSNLDLLIAGDGPEAAGLKQLAQDLSIEARLRFVGCIDGQAKIDLYRSAELFVCPSRAEPFANVILEAMACDLPVVASNVGGNLEMVDDGRTGLIFESQNIDDLATKLQQFMDNGALRQRMLEATRQHIKQFDLQTITDQYLDLYRKAITCAAC